MITALYVREDSVYKSLGLDCYDITRDARNYCGNNPVIAHPPCRAWGKFKHFAKPRPDKKQLAIFAIQKIRQVGGVLEHPHGSTLFKELFLPKPGCYDPFGGYTIELNQFNFGHRAEKKTWIYIFGCPIEDIPPIPKAIGEPQFVISSSKYRSGQDGYRKRVTDIEREATPIKFAKWLIAIAEKCVILAPA